MIRKLSATCIIILALILVSFGCAKKEPQEIKLGHIAPLTGDAAIWGNWESEGIELAVEEINKAGGISGKKIRVIHEDDRGDPKTCVSAIQKLIEVEKIKVIIGSSLSSTTLACAPIAEKNKVILLSPSAQSPKISEAGDYIFRIFASSSVEGKHLSALADKFGIKSAAILYLNNDYGVGLRSVISKELAEKKIPALAAEGYDSEMKDFKSQLSKIKAVSPGALFLLGYPTDMGTVLRQMKELRLNLRTFAPNSFEAEEITKIAGSAAEGVVYVYPVLPSVQATDEVKKRFSEKYKKEMNVYNGMGYDAVKILSVAVEKSLKEKGTVDGELVKKGLYEIKDFPGVTGPITFDQNGDVVDRPMTARIVKNGKFVDYQ